MSGAADGSVKLWALETLQAASVSHAPVAVDALAVDWPRKRRREKERKEKEEFMRF